MGDAQPMILQNRSPLVGLANRLSIEPLKLLNILKATVLKPTRGNPPTDEEVAAFVLVANRYGLDPMTREIHAFVDPNRGVVPIVGIDGWIRMVTTQPTYDGCEFQEIEDDAGNLVAMRCTIYRKDCQHPTVATEHLAECKRNTPPWNTMPRRMLRHKAFMQTGRLAFGISGVYDADEARDIIVNAQPSAPAEPPTRGVEAVKARLGIPVRPTPSEDDSAEKAAADAALAAQLERENGTPAVMADGELLPDLPDDIPPPAPEEVSQAPATELFEEPAATKKARRSEWARK